MSIVTHSGQYVLMDNASVTQLSSRDPVACTRHSLLVHVAHYGLLAHSPMLIYSNHIVIDLAEYIL